MKSFVLIIAILFQVLDLHAQLTWKQIATPGNPAQFTLSQDGMIYLATGDYATHYDIWSSTNRGSDWTKIYSCKWFSGIDCDSVGGVLIFSSDTLILSRDRGLHWNKITGMYFQTHSVSTGGLYVADPGFIYFIGNYGGKWDTIYRLDQIGDCYTQYAGANDRVLCDLTFNSTWALFDHRQQVVNTPPRPHFTTDNSPPSGALFGRDGFIYFEWLGVKARLAPNSSAWEVYSDTSYLHYDTVHHVPMASVDASTLIWAEPGRTLASYDHASSWTPIGEGMPGAAYVRFVAFDLNKNGYALTDSGLFISRYFADVKDEAPVQTPVVYPNPCDRVVTIAAMGVAQIEILDALGNCRILQQFSETDNPQVNVGALPVGVYWAIVRANGNVDVAKFIK